MDMSVCPRVIRAFRTVVLLRLSGGDGLVLDVLGEARGAELAAYAALL
jgi:hypothetical protein